MGTQLVHAGGGADIGLDGAEVVGSGTTKVKLASTHSPSLSEPPTRPSHHLWLGCTCQQDWKQALTSSTEPHAVAHNSTLTHQQCRELDEMF